MAGLLSLEKITCNSEVASQFDVSVAIEMARMPVRKRVGAGSRFVRRSRLEKSLTHGGPARHIPALFHRSGCGAVG